MRGLRYVLPIALVGLVAVPFLRGPRSWTIPPAPSQNEAALERKVPDLRLNDAPLTEVIRSLSAATNVRIEPAGGASLGADFWDKRYAVHLHDVPLGQVLTGLSQLQSTPDRAVRYEPAGGNLIQIEIPPPEPRYFHMYDLRPLLRRMRAEGTRGADKSLAFVIADAADSYDRFRCVNGRMFLYASAAEHRLAQAALRQVLDGVTGGDSLARGDGAAVIPPGRFSFGSSTASDALAACTRQAHQNVVADWSALASQGKSSDSKISGSLADPSFAAVLWTLLGTEGWPVSWPGSNVALQVVGQDLAVAPRGLRVYNLRSILDEEIAWLRPRLPTPQAAPGVAPTPLHDELIDQLLRRIEDAFESDIWRDNGGTAGCWTCDDWLMIDAPASVQAQIESMLQALAVPPAAATRSEGRPLPGPDPAYEALSRPIHEFIVTKEKFGHAIDRLAVAAQANVVIDTASLRDLNVTDASTVTVRLADVPLSAAVTTVLDSVTTKTGELGYYIHDGLIVITAADTARSNLTTRLYDVRDLIDADIAERLKSPPPTTNPGSLIRHLTTEPEDHYAAAVDTLTDLIERQHLPSSWRDNGGEGRILPLAGRFIITATPAVHLQIEAFLRTVRRGFANGNPLTNLTP